MDNLQIQKDEVIALRAIFEEQDILKISNNTITRANPSESCSDERTISAISGDFSVSPAVRSIINIKGGENSHIVHHLPPIVLGFQLPPGYPETSSPDFKLSSKWLSKPKLSRLCHRLDEIWEENFGSEILYLWYDFLFDQSLEHIGISDTVDLQKIHTPVDADSEEGQLTVDDRAIQESNTVREIIPYMLEYNKQHKQMIFERSGWLCDICYSEKPGSQCFQFTDCQHIYCLECMREHCSIKIRDGEVSTIICPTGQCESIVYPHQVKALVGNSMFERYEQLLLQITIDTMGDIVYCPRTFCQCPVIRDSQEEIMAQCPACFFAFCTKCKASYHAPMPCNVSKEELKKKILDATEEELEAYKERYSQEFLKALMNECATLNWIDENAKKCPACHVPVTKMDGCNKMTCYRCRCYFCWICEMILPRFDPYLHFKKSGQMMGCALFPGDEDIEVWFQDGN